MGKIVAADAERTRFKVGDRIQVGSRAPIGHYRVPTYLRGKRGVVEAIIQPAAIDNEEEGFGRNAGVKRHYYRIAVAMTEIWPGYAASPTDNLRIEVFESWLEGA